MKKVIIISIAVFLTGVMPAAGQFAADNHTVTVTVSPVSILQLAGGTINLDITSAQAVAGQDQMTLTDASTQLLWGTNSSAQKITAASDLVAPLFTLQAEATSATQGLPAGPVTLTTAPADLLLNLARSSGSCTVTYTALVLASQGTGTETHTITFTIQTQ